MTVCLRRALAAMCCCALLACGPAAPSYPGPAACEVGSGVLDFVEIEPGDAIPIIHGPQGGYHIWGSLRAKWLADHGVAVRYTLAWPDGTPINSVQALVDVTPIGGDGGAPGPDWGESLGSRVYVPDPSLINGQTIVLSVTATDADSRTCSDGRSMKAYE